MLLAVINAAGVIVGNVDFGAVTLSVDAKVATGQGSYLTAGENVACDVTHSAPDGCMFVAVAEVDIAKAGPGGTWTQASGFSPPVAPATSQPDLIAYANAKQRALAAGGYTLTLSVQSVTFETDDASQTMIAGKYLRLAQPNPPVTINWQLGNGSFVTLSAADFLAAAPKIADFVQATFDALKAVLAAITAGTITTMAAIDAAAWPATSG